MKKDSSPKGQEGGDPSEKMKINTLQRHVINTKLYNPAHNCTVHGNSAAEVNISYIYIGSGARLSLKQSGSVLVPLLGP